MAVTAAIALAGLGLAAYGAYEKHEAMQKAKNNKMPEYQIPQEEQDNLRLAQAYANRGISSQSYQAYMNNADRGLANTNSAILKSGGDANQIGQAQDKYEQGIGNLAIYDDQARQTHLNTLMAQNARMGSFADKNYQLNQYAPWANRAQLYAGQMAGANQTIGQGLGIFAQGAGQYGKSLGADDDDDTKLKYQNNPNNRGVPFRSAANTPAESVEMLPDQNTWGWNGAMPVNNAGNSQGPSYQPFYSPNVQQGSNS